MTQPTEILCRAHAEKFPGLLHFMYDAVYCIPESPTGHYWRVEAWANTPYRATYDNEKSAHQFAQFLSRRDRYDARVIRMNTGN